MLKCFAFQKQTAYPLLDFLRFLKPFEHRLLFYLRM